MEEDIKILEEYIDTDYGALKIWQINELNKCEDLRQSLENLIKGYRELEEKNKNLKYKFTKNGRVLFTPEAIAEKHIPKSKIKEKIEELEKKNKETYIQFLESDRANVNLSTKGKMIQGSIQVLQELMEE